ncbi:MAG: patatin [Deltaproteobacteria bacterium HGW-Deltaproteobacteria-9]|nr:MAG: patatin [Deltaproteobacteria bacterium HGW-Deltaproteobacteria-9]
MSDNNSGFPKNIGLALGSGSARGWAHIGVIRALADAGIEVKCIAGASIGSLVGAAFALGKMDVLEGFARQLDWRQIVSFLDVTFPRSGLIDGEKITDFFRSHVREMNIEELPLPYCAVATDLSTGREVVLNGGDLIEAIRASISVPGIFTPVKKNGGFLVDGGLVNPVPVSAARNMGADYVIAVDLNHDIFGKRSANNIGPVAPPTKYAVGQFPPKKRGIAQDLRKRLSEFNSPALSQVRLWLHRDPVPNIFEVLTTSINIIEAQITAARLVTDPPDLLIQPRLGHIRFLEFHRAQEAIDEGYREATTQLTEKWKGAAARDFPKESLSGRKRGGK